MKPASNTAKDWIICSKTRKPEKKLADMQLNVKTSKRLFHMHNINKMRLTKGVFDLIINAGAIEAKRESQLFEPYCG
jgi:hypothetical protein